MKVNYIFGLLALAGAMSLVSCDDFLNDNRYPLSSQVANSEFWSNSSNVDNQINYFYEDYSGYGNGSGSGTFYWSWLSDDQSGRTTFKDWEFVTVPTSSTNWTNPYKEIRRANLVIEGVEGSTLKDSEKANYTALARLHRARNYFNLVKRYGDVPLVKTALDPTDDAELYGSRTDRDEVMDFVLEDLNYAVENIATTSSKTSFSRDLAYAVKAEICLFEGTYAKYNESNSSRASKYLNEAVSAGEAIASKYPIGSSYESLYKSFSSDLQKNGEVIFMKAYTEGVFMNSISDYSNASDGVAGITKDAFNAYLFKDGKPAASTSYNNTDAGVAEVIGDSQALSIQNLLDVRDQRLAQVTYPYAFFQGLSWAASNTVNQWSSTGYGVSKFNNLSVPQATVNEINKNYLSAPLYWGARLYLAIAEAKAELGTLTDADVNTYLNPLYQRAGLPDQTVASLTAINDPANNMGVSSLLWEVRRCRRCELIMDDGIRYWDLIRWHQLELLDSNNHPDILLGANISNSPIACTVAKGNYVDASFGRTRTFNSKYYFYPIPSDEIQLNPNLTQNPGWE
jgi:hypothetical protein